MFTCDRCKGTYLCVSWKSQFLQTPFYMCNECWDAFFKMVPHHPIMASIWGERKLEKMKWRIRTMRRFHPFGLLLF